MTHPQKRKQRLRDFISEVWNQRHAQAVRRTVGKQARRMAAVVLLGAVCLPCPAADWWAAPQSHLRVVTLDDDVAATLADSDADAVGWGLALSRAFDSGAFVEVRLTRDVDATFGLEGGSLGLRTY